MSWSLTEKLKLTFDLASLRHEASKKLNGDEWKGYQTIRDRYDADRQTARATYWDEYQSRVETVRAELLRQAGAKTLDLKPKYVGNDRFDANALGRQAHRQVQSRHQRDLDEIDRRELFAIDVLLEGAEKRHRERMRFDKLDQYTHEQVSFERRVDREDKITPTENVIKFEKPTRDR